jgi:hypothetical protein
MAITVASSRVSTRPAPANTHRRLPAISPRARGRLPASTSGIRPLKPRAEKGSRAWEKRSSRYRRATAPRRCGPVQGPGELVNPVPLERRQHLVPDDLLRSVTDLGEGRQHDPERRRAQRTKHRSRAFEEEGNWSRVTKLDAKNT